MKELKDALQMELSFPRAPSMTVELQLLALEVKPQFLLALAMVLA